MPENEMPIRSLLLLGAATASLDPPFDSKLFHMLDYFKALFELGQRHPDELRALLPTEFKEWWAQETPLYPRET